MEIVTETTHSLNFGKLRLGLSFGQAMQETP